MKEYYTVRVRCNNCGFKGAVTIKQSYRINQRCCPTCGCPRLSREMFTEGYPASKPPEEVNDENNR